MQSLRLPGKAIISKRSFLIEIVTVFLNHLEIEIPENECEKTQDSRGRSSSKVPEIEESFLGITTQISVPFFIAGMGMVGAGLVMDVIQV